MKTINQRTRIIILMIMVLQPFITWAQDSCALRHEHAKYRKAELTGPAQCLVGSEIGETNAALLLNRISAINIDSANSIISWYYRGVEDAEQYYAAKKSGKRSVLVISLLCTPVIGIIPAIICSGKAPKQITLKYRIKPFCIILPI